MSANPKMVGKKLKSIDTNNNGWSNSTYQQPSTCFRGKVSKLYGGKNLGNISKSRDIFSGISKPIADNKIPVLSPSTQKKKSQISTRKPEVASGVFSSEQISKPKGARFKSSTSKPSKFSNNYLPSTSNEMRVGNEVDVKISSGNLPTNAFSFIATKKRNINSLQVFLMATKPMHGKSFRSLSKGEVGSLVMNSPGLFNMFAVGPLPDRRIVTPSESSQNHHSAIMLDTIYNQFDRENTESSVLTRPNGPIKKTRWISKVLTTEGRKTGVYLKRIDVEDEALERAKQDFKNRGPGWRKNNGPSIGVLLLERVGIPVEQWVTMKVPVVIEEEIENYVRTPVELEKEVEKGKTTKSQVGMCKTTRKPPPTKAQILFKVFGQRILREKEEARKSKSDNLDIKEIPINRKSVWDLTSSKETEEEVDIVTVDEEVNSSKKRANVRRVKTSSKSVTELDRPTSREPVMPVTVFGRRVSSEGLVEYYGSWPDLDEPPTWMPRKQLMALGPSFKDRISTLEAMSASTKAYKITRHARHSKRSADGPLIDSLTVEKMFGVSTLEDGSCCFAIEWLEGELSDQVRFDIHSEMIELIKEHLPWP